MENIAITIYGGFGLIEKGEFEHLKLVETEEKVKYEGVEYNLHTGLKLEDTNFIDRYLDFYDFKANEDYPTGERG